MVRREAAAIEDAKRITHGSNYVTRRELEGWREEHEFDLLDPDIFVGVTGVLDHARMAATVRAEYQEMLADIRETSVVTEEDFRRGRAEVTIAQGADLVVSLGGATGHRWRAAADLDLGPGEEHRTRGGAAPTRAGRRVLFYWDDVLAELGRFPGTSEHRVAFDLIAPSGKVEERLRLEVNVEGPDEAALVDDPASSEVRLAGAPELRQGFGALGNELVVPWWSADSSHRLVAELVPGVDPRTGADATFVRVADYRDPSRNGRACPSRREERLHLPLLPSSSWFILQNRDGTELLREQVI